MSSGIPPEAQLHQQFFNYLKASILLDFAWDVKEADSSLRMIIVYPDHTYGHTEWKLGNYVRGFFKNVLEKNENLPLEVKELCKTYINNWVLAINIALSENPREPRGERKDAKI